MFKLSEEKFEAAFFEVSEYLKGINSPPLYILQTHLFSEHLLEKIIKLNLPKADKLLKGSRLNFSQKLRLVESFDIIEGEIISSLNKLNQVRNDLAHKFDHTFDEKDVERFGKPLGTTYTRILEKMILI